MTIQRSQPHRRGLIAATAGFAIVIACVVAWLELPDHPETALPGRASTPTFPQFRSSRASSTAPTKADLLPGQDETFTRRHRARGAIVGTAAVRAGDLIDVGGTRFRLADIRAIAGYYHHGPNAHHWPRGTTPEQALRLKVGNTNIACYPHGNNAQGETLGRCLLGETAGRQQGMALPTGNRSDYQIKQSIAKREARGWWSTQRED